MHELSLLCEPGTNLRFLEGGLDLYMRGGGTRDLSALRCVAPRCSQSGTMLSHTTRGVSAWLNLAEVELAVDPYPYLIAVRAMRPQLADHLLKFLRDRARWCVNDGGFYRARECDLLTERIPPELAHLVSPHALQELSDQASLIFGEKLRVTGAVAGHRLDVGQGIGLHSDHPKPGEETHRLLITLAEAPTERGGGHFVLFSSREAETMRRIIPLRHNEAIAFALTERSYHAVTVVRSQCRFSIVFSFAAPA